MKKKARTLILILLMIAVATVMVSCGRDGDEKDMENIRESSQAVLPSDDSTNETQGNEGNHNETHHDDEHSVLPEQTQPSDIGVEGAKAIALGMVSGANASNITEIEREYDDGRLKYEGELHYDGYEYEFEIDGTTGNILKWEIDD